MPGDVLSGGTRPKGLELHRNNGQNAMLILALALVVGLLWSWFGAWPLAADAASGAIRLGAALAPGAALLALAAASRVGSSACAAWRAVFQVAMRAAAFAATDAGRRAASQRAQRRVPDPTSARDGAQRGLRPPRRWRGPVALAGVGWLAGATLGVLVAEEWRATAWIPDLDLARGLDAALYAAPDAGAERGAAQSVTPLQATARRDEAWVMMMRVSLVTTGERHQRAMFRLWPAQNPDSASPSALVEPPCNRGASDEKPSNGATPSAADRHDETWTARRVELLAFAPRGRPWAHDEGAGQPSRGFDLAAIDCGVGRVRWREVSPLANAAGFDAARHAFASGLHARATLQTFTPIACSDIARDRHGQTAGPGLAARTEHRLRLVRERLDRRWFSEAPTAFGESGAPAARPLAGWVSPDAWGLARALVLGERDRIAQADWAALLATGTNHLVAISGLHVALVAGAAAAAGLASHAALVWGWGRWWGASRGVVALPRSAIVLPVSLGAAGAYAVLAGLSIPTQRAWLMVALAGLALAVGGRLVSWRLFALVLIVVTLWQPAAILSPGFWFSFVAVALIVADQSGRLRALDAARGVSLQLWLAVATIPVAGAAFGLWSTLAVPANLVAVPWVSLVGLPLLLLGAALSLVSEALGAPVLALGAWSLQGLSAVLRTLAAWPGAVGHGARPGLLLGVWVAVLALWWLGTHRSTSLRSQPPGRWLVVAAAFASWLAALWWAPLKPDIEPGAFEVDVVDVGQGLAVVVRTRSRVLVYDTGPGGLGARALTAVLEQHGVRHIDVITISHEDLDHRGGLDALRERFSIGQIQRRAPDLDALPAETRCEAGSEWVWDGVRFRTLHPPPGWDASDEASCVLHIQSLGQRKRAQGPDGGALLLTGDVEGLGEFVLLRKAGARLRADVLQVPHHGARRALEHGLLEASGATLAVNASGRRNAYGHPHPAVRERVDRAGVAWCDTGDWGRLRLRFDADGYAVLGAARAAARPWSLATPTRPSVCAGDG